MAPDSSSQTGSADAGGISLSASSLESVTQLIEQAQSGRQESWDEIYRIIYRELYEAARIQLRRGGRERSATSLINRAWLRFDSSRVKLLSRQHLLAVMSRAMRFALIDEARRLNTLKRGKQDPLLSDAIVDAIDCHRDLDELLALDQALSVLADVDPRLGQLVEMRYFSEMSEAEIAQAMGVSDRTVQRDWSKARAFLVSRLASTSWDDAERR